MTVAFEPPRPPYAQYSPIGEIRPSDYLVYFRAMMRNPLEVWGEHHFHIRVVPFRWLGRSSVIINDPDAIHHCFVSNAANYEMNPLRQAVLRPFLRDGLLTAEGQIWKSARKAVSPVFTPRRVNAFAPTILDVCQDATDRIASQAGETISVSQTMIDLTLDVLMETLFSGDDALDKPRFSAGINRLTEISGVPHLFDLLRVPGWMPRIGHGEANRVIRELRDQVGQVAAARRADPHTADSDRAPDFLDLLLGAGLDDTAVIDNLLTFLAAGHETTARTMAWTLYLLSQAPDVRERLEAEIDAAELDPDQPEKWGDHLPWTVAVLKESMRLYPAAPALARTSKDADRVGEHDIPAGTDLLVSTWLLHRQREIWEHPDEFRPERFFGEAAKAIPKDAYLPFGIGPRICIGARFAMMEMVILMAELSKRMRFIYEAEDHPVPVMRISLQPDIDLRMRIEAR